MASPFLACTHSSDLPAPTGVSFLNARSRRTNAFGKPTRCSSPSPLPPVQLLAAVAHRLLETDARGDRETVRGRAYVEDHLTHLSLLQLLCSHALRPDSADK